MLNKLFNDRTLSRVAFVKRLINISSESDLINQMKLMNNNKQFQKTLELFDKHKKKNLDEYSNLILTQVLKACGGIGDLQRGQTIHHLISSRLENDSYMFTPIIHLYSTFKQQ